MSLDTNTELTGSIFNKILINSNELDDKSKQFIYSKFIELNSNHLKNIQETAFNNWSCFINKSITNYAIYYYNYSKLVPRLLKQIWNKLSEKQQNKWSNIDYTDNYPYILLLFDYSINDCDILYRSFNSYMEDNEFYMQFNIITARLFMSLNLDNEYLLSYIVENIIFYMQRRILTMCKSSKEIRHKIIKLLVAYKQNAYENGKIYTTNLLKKLVYYDRHGGLLVFKTTFNEKLQIKYF